MDEVLNIQAQVARDYKKYKLPAEDPDFYDFCFPQQYRLQKPQMFLGEYMAPPRGGLERGPRELLVYHRIGAGKTCTAINICEQWVKRCKPVVVMPASLIPGFRNELRTPCAGDRYITSGDRQALASLNPRSAEYRAIIKASNTAIDQSYTILSYNGFAAAIRSRAPALVTDIVVIDEVQNIVSQGGSYYTATLQYINSLPPTTRIVLLSATPIFDSPVEIFLLMQLLRRPYLPPEDFIRGGHLVERAAFMRHIGGVISYYQGAPKSVFPRTTLEYTICKMSPFQARHYSDIAEREQTIRTHKDPETDSFYLYSRQASNIIYPKGLPGTDGLPLLSGAKLKENLAKYSAKFAKLMRRLRHGGLTFIYTSFTGIGGMKPLVKILRAWGYLDYATAGPGPNRYALWSGRETPRYKDEVRKIFNQPDNRDGGHLRIIIGSPAIKEGVSLFRVASVHILEPYWNFSRIEQVIGRAVRYCSHKDLPKRQRHVNVYIYLAVNTGASAARRQIAASEFTPEVSVDGYIYGIARAKKELIAEFSAAMIEASIDRRLNRN